jgi:DNA-directed RNA polymerase subunit H (RpoH/RPB5)
MDSTNSYIKQIYTARKNVISYLKNNGYDCSDYEIFCFEEINIMKDTNNLSFIVKNSLDEKCYVKYEIDTTFKHNVLKKNSILALKTDIFDSVDGNEPILSKNDTLFIVTTNYSEDSLHAMIKNSWEQEGIFIVLFNLAHLQINILQHTYVPKHIKMSDEEAREFYKKFNVNETQIPEISRFDPVARALCLRPKQLCKITRYDKISYKNDYYRICVS